jgi:CHAT domain-containing protein
MTRHRQALIAVAVVVSVCGGENCRQPRSALSLLVDSLALPPADGPRFSSGFSLPFDITTAIDSSHVEALEAAERVARAARSMETRARFEYAIVQALAGRIDSAMTTLEQVVAAEPMLQEAWSDLAAVYLLRAHRTPTGGHEYWFRALDASLRATELMPGNPDAWFNRALAIDRAGLLAVEDAWAVYRNVAGHGEGKESPGRGPTVAARWHHLVSRLSRGPDSVSVSLVRDSLPTFVGALREYVGEVLLPRVAAESGKRLDATALLTARVVVEELTSSTGDALIHEALDRIERADSIRRRALAQGHDLFARARGHFDANRYREAAKDFVAATELLRRNGSPFWLWSETNLALCLYYLRDLEGLSDKVGSVIAASPAARYPIVRARAEWAEATAEFTRGDIDAAMRRYRTALALFRKTGEFENEAAVATVMAEVSRQLGDDLAAWRFLSEAILPMSRLRQPMVRYQILFVASLLAGQYDLPRASLLLEDYALQVTRERELPGPIVEGLTRLAQARLRVGDRAGASRNLAEAAAVLPLVESRDLAAALEDALATAQGDFLSEDRDGDAVELLQRTARRRSVTLPSEVPGVFLRLGRLLARRGDLAGAERAFDDGIQAFEQRRATIESAAQRVSFLDEAWSLYSERLELRYRASSRGEAVFEEADRIKGRVVRELTTRASSDTGSLINLQQRLSEGQAVLAYAILPNRVLGWLVTGSRWEVRELPIAPRELGRLIAGFRDSIAAGDYDASFRSQAQRLFQILLEPFAAGGHRLLMILPDGALHALPFSALLRPDGEFLVSGTEIVIAPNVGVLLNGAAKLAADGAPPRSALVVGDPAFDLERFPDLPRLANARQEAVAVSAQYALARTVVGADASTAMLRDNAGNYDVLHFGGHAIENSRHPWRSALLLARSNSDPGVVHAEDIAHWRLTRTKVVALAACDTGIGRIYKGEGVISLATPFLAAGVPAVVTTLWKVDDGAARRVFERFHGGLAQGLSPSAALQSAQKALSESDTFANPRDWAGYVLVGSTRLEPVH